MFSVSFRPAASSVVSLLAGIPDWIWPTPMDWLWLTLLGLLVTLAVALAAVVPPFLAQFQELLRQLPAAADLNVLPAKK